MSYLDFILQILPGTAGQPAVYVQSERGQGRALLHLPSDSARWEGESFWEALPDGRDVVMPTVSGGSGARREIGEVLFEALFSGEVLRLYERCLDQIESRRLSGLRIKLMIDPREAQVAPLQRLPWELMRQPGTPEFLALSRRRLLVRYLAVPRSGERLPRPACLRILCVAPKPIGAPRLSLERELIHLREAIGTGNGLEVVLPEAPTLEGVRRALLEQECHVLHFMGHGSLTREGKGCLVFEQPDGHRDLIPGEDLANKISDIPGLRLAVFNACNSGSTSGASLFAGVAASVVLGGLPAVVAMQAPVSDRAAIVFSRELYRGLAAGEPVDLAVTEARQAVHSMSTGGVEWAKPVAFMRVSDGHLYEPEAADPPIDHLSPRPGESGVIKRPYQNPAIVFLAVLVILGMAWLVVPLILGEGPVTPASHLSEPEPVSFPVVVIDDETGNHVAGARVVADEQGVSTETDSEGRCTLSVRPGHEKLRVTISQPGYQTRNVELTIFKGMDPARIRLQREVTFRGQPS